ncbi:unnamed protein product [Spodoptera littoralis]|uniref:Carboxylic ester hydrolase n=1 Tax=Spodoptera littoralis TaxID=7109 RepID=A0A9P0IAU2_SPOLI|nr:unnamed protein product [Spodoptera littoralis]CAH1643303.1 unnamed protein product [Spodoptera littoralis]
MKSSMCVLVFYLAVVITAEEWREVKIAQGTLRGRKNPEKDVFVFYNVPYATAPVGKNKFKTDKNNLSVVVYVHGGGFIVGFGNMMKPLHLLDKKDIILVTFNYRLGIHGFLCLGTEVAPGNAGMKDQVALLKWVHQNIASFGGNPDDVTLVGNSAGSASVDLLMLSKSAEGLFHRVVPESGGNLAAFTIASDPVENAKSFLRQLNYTDVDDICDVEEFYKTASLQLLTSDAFFERTDSTFLFSPCVERDTEGAFLTEAPLSILKKGNFKKLPLLYGFANMEGLFRIDFFDSWKNKMNEKFSDFLTPDLKFQSESEREQVSNKIKKFYFGEKPVGNESAIAFVNYFSDVLFTHPMLWAAKYYVEGGNSQVYLYEYSFVDEDSTLVPYTDIRGATHCAQTIAVVDIGDESKLSQKYQDMKKTMREIWYNFIKTGKPVPEGSSLPAWPAAGPDRSPYMKLNEKLELGGILLEERTQFWDDIYGKYYRDPAAPPASPKCQEKS